ncbi:nucleoside-triphosphatase THEP1-like isoform X1 [Maniola jurtina]|uniref:nucleoside-triphosphatase THEP1-like isoform X1 n=1 Tax=Maniola jurtina TaxID=191418 RepID=UPI001E686115|nr:nucleoside-triphosphatase THEP1-like isoform X1 [Maniola jurtina]
MAKKINFFILSGDPGVGKTTLTKKICLLLNEKGVKTVGFFTEEVRRNQVREGFDVVSLNGERGRLAREKSLLSSPAQHTVGKYDVLLQEFENIALQSMRMKPEDNETCVLVIDEIGKMEFFSTNFKSRIKEIFSPASKNIVLATIPVRQSDPLIESIRNNSRSKVWIVTRANRNTIHEEIEREIYKAIKI